MHDLAAKLVVTLERIRYLPWRPEVSLAVQNVAACTIWNSYAVVV